MNEELTQALEISQRDLLGNIAEREWRAAEGLKRCEIILAGRTKFTELWARDAAFAVPALLALGRADVVGNTLEAFFDLQHSDGRFPRRLSGMSNAARNVRVGIRNWFGVQLPPPPRIRPEFRTSGPRLLWYRGRPKDVNSLILSATAAYHACGHAPSFVSQRRPALERALAALARDEADGLIKQHHFEDWEDHTKHSGHGLYTNVLYFQALREVAAMEGVWSRERRAALLARADAVAQRLGELWLEEDGYFQNFLRPRRRVEPFSVPGNMLALTSGLATGAQAERVAGRLEEVVEEYGYVPIAAPGYPLSMAPAARALFVRHYLSGRLMLPWLQLLAARAVAPLHPQFAHRLVEQVARPVVRYGRSVEALIEGRTPMRYFFTAPEEHFSWGSAALFETCAALQELGGRERPADSA